MYYTCMFAISAAAQKGNMSREHGKLQKHKNCHLPLSAPQTGVGALSLGHCSQGSRDNPVHMGTPSSPSRPTEKFKCVPYPKRIDEPWHFSWARGREGTSLQLPHAGLCLGSARCRKLEQHCHVPGLHPLLHLPTLTRQSDPFKKNARKLTRRCASNTVKTVETVETLETLETLETVDTLETSSTHFLSNSVRMQGISLPNSLHPDTSTSTSTSW